MQKKLAYRYTLHDGYGGGSMLSYAQTIEQATKELYVRYGALLKEVTDQNGMALTYTQIQKAFE